MKKFLLLLTLFCAMFSTVKATEVEIGTDATDQTNVTYIPINALWNYSWSQQIYTSEEIGVAGTINSLTLWAYYTGSRTGFDVNIYMAEVSEDEFATTSSWVSLGSGDLVFSGTAFSNLPTTAATMAEYTITLQTPFNYNGTGHLLIAFADNSGPTYSSGLNCKAFGATTDPKRALYKSQDSGAIDPTTPGVTGTLQSKRNVIKLDITTGGPVVVCDKPETVEANDVTAHEATIVWSGTAASYNLQYKASGAGDWTLVKNLTSTSYQLTNLAANTSYQAQVQSICGENTSGWKSVSFTTLIGLPYVENFNGSSKPTGWNTYSGLLQPDGSVTLTSSSNWSFGTNNGVFDSHARSNIYGSSSYKWLVLPAIPIPEMDEGDLGFQMTFDLALTKYSGDLAEITKTLGMDDRFLVLASIDDGANWTTLREWNNTGSEYVYNDIAVAGEEVEPIDLSAYAGQTILLAFYGESTVSETNSDNNIHVDNVSIDAIPSCLKPTGLHDIDGTATKSSLQIAWTANSGEEAWSVQFKPSDAAETEWVTVDATDTLFTITGLQAFTTYDIRVAAVCAPEGEEAVTTDYCKAIKAKTASGVPFSQTFNTASLPMEWKRYEIFLEEVENGGAELIPSDAGWIVDDANGIFTEAGKHLVLNVAGAECKAWIVSPIIEIDSIGYQLTFDLALTDVDGAPVGHGAQNDHKFVVLISQNGGESWQRLITWDNQGTGLSYDGINSASQTAKYDLSAFAGHNVMVAFYGESTSAEQPANLLHIANVKIAEIPACSPASSLNIIDIEDTSATAVWEFDEDGAAWQYGLIENPAADFVPADADFANDTVDVTVALSNLTPNTDYVFFLRHVCEGGDKSEALVKFFKTFPAPKVAPWTEDFESFTAETVPAEWDNSASTSTTLNTYPERIWGVYEYNGNKMIRMYNYFVSSGIALINSPRIVLPAEEISQLRFDYAHTATCGEFTLKISADNGKTWADLGSYGKTSTGTDKDDPGDFASIEINLDQYTGQTVILQFFSNANYGSGAIFVDNITIQAAPDCMKPTGLAVSQVSAEGAIVSWNEESDGMTWVYAVAPAAQGEPADDAFAPIAVNSIQLEDLEDCTLYKFYLRKQCVGAQSESETISFQTRQNAVEVGLSFSDDFEGEAKWLLNNGGLTNAWVIGTAAHNGEGTHALYISNDGGTTHAYTVSSAATVFAQKAFYFVSGSYTFQYDWLCNGESTWDFIRVALVPSDAVFAPGTALPDGVTYSSLPTGCIALDGGSKLNLVDTWQTFTSAAIAVPEGIYNVVIMWRDDTSSGTNPPAAIDNFSISKIACATPVDFQAVDSLSTTSSALLKWTPMSDETNFIVRYKAYGEAEWADSIAVDADSLLLTGLAPSTIYEAQVATWCDPEDAENIGTFSASMYFATACAPVAAVDEDFEAGLICWKSISETYVQSGTTYYFPNVYKNADKATSGTNYLYFLSQFSGTPADQYAILPELISLDGMRIKFNARKEDDTDEDTEFYVGIMTDPTADSTFVALDTFPLNSTTYAQYIVPFTGYTGEGKYVAIMMPASTEEYATLLIDDVVVDEIPNCSEAAGPITVLNVTGDSAFLAWPAEEGAAWKYAYAPTADGEPADEAFVAITDTAIAIGNLEDRTSYTFYLRRDCGSMMSPSINAAFTTPLKPATIPFADDFESVNKWELINGALTNAWVLGEAAHNGEGTHALYISNDGGVSNAYTLTSAAVVYAVKPFHFEEGNYVFQYDWKAKGESTYDYLRVALVPASVEFTASTSLPSGLSTTAFPAAWNATALDGGSKLNLVDTWQTFRTDALAIAEGDYKVVLIWRDDTSTGAQTPAAVDNFSIEKLNCIRPDSLVAVAEGISNHSVQIDWTPISGESNWLVQYKKSSEEEWTLVAEDVNVHPFTVNGLDASSAYNIRVAAWCDPTDSLSASEYSLPIMVMTECDAITVFPYAENFDSYEVASAYTPTERVLPVCWSAINTCTYSSYKNYPTVYYYSTTDYSNSTPNSLRFYSYNYVGGSTNYDPQDQYAILPEMEDINTLRLKFNARAYSASYDADFYVGVMSDPSDTATFVAIAHLEPAGVTYEAFDVKLNSYQGTGKYIAIKMLKSPSSYRGFYMDDIVVEKLPACMEPEDVVASNFTASSATISWTNGAEGQEAWQIVYSADPAFDIANVAAEEIIDVASNPYELSGLEADTLYTVYVRANCGEPDGVSLWTSATFRTAKSCQMPDNLAAADITINSASISWNTYGQTGFNLRYISGTDTVLVENAESPYALTELEDAADYYVQVQVVCDAENWSETLHFTTLQIPATVPYATDFEAKNGWAFINGALENVWAYGEAAHNGEGTHALYISNDGGAANAYTGNKAAVVYATKLFNLEAGSYTFKYDWRCQGEGTSTLWDYLRVVLVPDSVELEAATTMPSGVTATALPSNWIALDGGRGLNQQSTWQTFISEDITITSAGLYKVVLLWRDDTSTGNDPAAAVDNFSITKLTCLKPLNVTASDVYAHSAKLSWSAGEASAWQIAIDTISAFNPDTVANLIDVNDSLYIFSNLLPTHTYYVYVRANCGVEDGVSDWSAKKSFTTTVACPAPTGLEVELTPGNGSIATLTWNAGEASAWTVEYSLNSNMSDSLIMSVDEPVANLTGLTAEATYYARVKASCGEDGESAYSAIISFVPTSIYSIVVNDGTQTNSYVPIYGTWADDYTRSQFIVPEADLEEIEWDTITTLTFYASNANVSWGAAEFKVYMAEAPETTLSELADWNALTEVMSDASLSIVDNKMVVTLSEPYQYQGGNLLIGFYQTVKGSYAGCSWYGKNVTGASFGGYGNGNGVSQRNFLPKMTISYVPGIAPACPKARNLAVSDITAEGASFTWKAVEGAAWEYAVAYASAEIPTEFTAVPEGANVIAVEGLDEATAYKFYLRRACGEDGESEIISIEFETLEAVATLPYAENFDAATGWKFQNAATNAWMIGASASEEGNALYISNNGAAYAYDDEVASVSFATKLFNFDVNGAYTVSYDWKAEGEFNDEDGAIDYMRAALVPASVELEGGVKPAGLTESLMPAGWIALDEDSALVAQSEWTNKEVTVDVVAGLYRLVFIWINDESDSDGAPAAIDNIAIERTGWATDIEGGAGIEGKAVKFMKNNHIYILKNGVVYSITGQKVEVK